MEQAERKDFGKPDEVREFPQGRVELVSIGGATVGRAVFEPGWRWSSSVQPLVKTKSCEAAARATFRCCLRATTPGWSETNPPWSSTFRA